MKNNYARTKGYASFLLIFLLAFISAQKPKLDQTFRAILINKTNILSKRFKVTEEIPGSINTLKDLQATTRLGNDTFYSAIIYTKNPQALKNKGIHVQSEFSKFVTAMVTIEDLETLQSMPEVTEVRAPRQIPYNNEIARGESGASLIQSGALNKTKYTGKGVLVGVIDTGIDWSHPDFRDPVDQGKSRILTLWDQTIKPVKNEVSPTKYKYGVLYTKKDIEAELSGATKGYVREIDNAGHGTHVTGTAAGNGAALTTKKFAGMAPEADLVIVKAGNGSFSDTNIINGVKYLQSVADSLNKPLVINMSLGGQFSAHDGTGSQESAINEFTSSGPGRVVVLAAGNDNGTKVHKRNMIAPGETATISFTVPTDTKSTNLFAFLLYSNSNSDFSVLLTDPNNNSIPLAADSDLGDDGTQYSTNGFLGYAYNYIDTDNNNRYLQFLVQRPTGNTSDAIGNWTAQIKNNGSASITTDGWLYYSIKDANENKLVKIVDGDSQYLIGSPSSASNAITTASYAGRVTWYSQNTNGGYGFGGMVSGIAPSSSNGPLRNENQKPDIAATGQFIGSALPKNLRNPKDFFILDKNYYQVMTGTSMASPVVAGASALLLQMNPNATYKEIKDLLLKSTQKDNATGNIIPNPVWGYGKLDVFQAGAKLLKVDNVRKTYTYETMPYNGDNTTNLKVNTARIAVRFTPDLNGKLGGFFINTWGPPKGISNYTVEIRKNNNGLPGDILATKNIPLLNVDTYTWNYFDLSDLSVNLTSGNDFHVVIYSPDNGAWNTAIATDGVDPIADAKQHLSTSSDNGASWSPSTYVLRFRAVAYGEDAPPLAVKDETDVFGIQVYPNPATEVVNVKLNKAEKASFKLFDLGGKLVKEITSAKQVTDINITSLPKGVYILNINTGKESVNKKIIKK